MHQHARHDPRREGRDGRGDVENCGPGPDPVNADDPRGIKPIIRLLAAMACAFSFAAWVGLSVVGYLAPPEPALGRMGRLASAAIFVVSLVWGIWLYREFKREGG